MEEARRPAVRRIGDAAAMAGGEIKSACRETRHGVRGEHGVWVGLAVHQKAQPHRQDRVIAVTARRLRGHHHADDRSFLNS
jgi:hypothetical protein